MRFVEISKERVAGEQEIFHRDPLKFPKIETDEISLSLLRDASNLAILVF